MFPMFSVSYRVDSECFTNIFHAQWFILRYRQLKTELDILLPRCRSGEVKNHENPRTWSGAQGFLGGHRSSYALFLAVTGLLDE